MSGIVAQPVGITSPPIDDLLEHVDSKYALVIFAAKRARQINSYNLQLQQNMIQFVGPVVDVLPAVPEYLDVELSRLKATLVRRPKRADVPVTVDVQMVVEHYSR